MRKLPVWSGCILAAGLLFTAVTEFPAGNENPKTLAVIRVSDRTGDPVFKDLLITRGIANLISQALHDVGGYIPIEEKPEIRTRISDLLLLTHREGHKDVGPLGPDPDTVCRQLGCDAVAYGEIRKFKKSRIRGFFGPASGASVKISVEVEVYLKESGRPLRSAVGAGTGKTKSAGFLFQVREGTIHFDETSVGRAVQEAVHRAVEKLI